MSISLKCKCGEVYQADEKYSGYSIKCHNCHHINQIPNNKSESSNFRAKSNSSQPNNKTIFENPSIEPSHSLKL